MWGGQARSLPSFSLEGSLWEYPEEEVRTGTASQPAAATWAMGWECVVGCAWGAIRAGVLISRFLLKIFRS